MAKEMSEMSEWQTIKLHNFRCFEQMEMEFHDRLTVIVGILIWYLQSMILAMKA